MRHPLPLLTSEVPRIALNSQQTILLAQDLHAPFTDWENGWLAQRAHTKVLLREFDEYVDALALVRPQICQVIMAARSLEFQVIYSCLGYRPPEAPSPFQTATGWCWELDGPNGAFPADLALLPAEPIFAKPGWGALANPAFSTWITEQAIQNVVIVGTFFEFGIRQSCLELADRGIGVLVVTDGVAALTQAGEKQARGELAHGLVKFRTGGEVLDLLAHLSTEQIVYV